MQHKFCNSNLAGQFVWFNSQHIVKSNAALRITWFITGQYNTKECGEIMGVI